MFPYPVIKCQGLSNLLGLLAVGLNELETALMYNNKIKLIQKEMGNLHRVRMFSLTNNMNCPYWSGQKFTPSRLKTNKHQTRFKL